MSLDSFLKKLLCWRHTIIERWIKKVSRLIGVNSDHSQHTDCTDWGSVWTDIRVELTKRDDGKTRAQASHLRSHPLGSPSDAAGLLRLHRLPLGQVVGGVLLVLCVVGQGGFLHRPADESKLIEINVNTFTGIHIGFFLKHWEKYLAASTYIELWKPYELLPF